MLYNRVITIFHGRFHPIVCVCVSCMGFLPDTYTCGLRMRRECREHFHRHRLQRKPLDNDPGMHHGTCVTHVPRCMSGSLIRGGGENVHGIPGACTSRNISYLARGPCVRQWTGLSLLRVMAWHYRYPCWIIVSSTIKNLFKWFFFSFCKNDALENAICKMTAIVFRPRCFKGH